MELAVAELAVAMVYLAYTPEQEQRLLLEGMVVAVPALVAQRLARQVKYGWISYRDIKGPGLSLYRMVGLELWLLGELSDEH